MPDSPQGKLTALMRLSKRINEDTVAAALDDALTLVGQAAGAQAGVILVA